MSSMFDVKVATVAVVVATPIQQTTAYEYYCRQFWF